MIPGILSGLKGIGGGGSKAISNSNSSASATNALNLAFNPVLASTVGGQMYPYTSGDSYGDPSSSSSATASPSDSNPSSQIPWYYGSGGNAPLNVGQYPVGKTGQIADPASESSSMVLFAMIGIALIFLMKK